MRKSNIGYIITVFFLCAIFMFMPCISSASTLTVEEQEPKYKYTARPSEKLFIQETASKNELVYDATAGIIQGVDSNPLLDSTHKADSYTEEDVDLHFRYPLLRSSDGELRSKFGGNLVNMNYYNINDVNIFDITADVGLEYEIFDKITFALGYLFDSMYFPHDKNGGFFGNQMNLGIAQNLTDRSYHKLNYQLLIKDFMDRKYRLGNGTLASKVRKDARNVIEYELGYYLTDKTKLKVTDKFYINNSNDQYFDYYDYINNRVGVSVVQHIFKNLYNITGFYYQRRNYDSRIVSDKDATQKDNFYLVTVSFLYDITKDLSAFLNYSHTENHTNEPLEQYSDNLYSTGLYYSF